MLLRLSHNDFPEGTTDAVDAAVAIVVRAIARERTRRFAPGKAAKIACIRRLIEAEAWTDALLVLIELELPQWGLRRLAREDGEWFCSLSTHPALPTEMGETVEAHHELPAAAILQAFFEARERTARASQTPSARVPQIRAQQPVTPLICDNFG